MTPVQPPTCIRTYVRTVDDARTIFHAVACGILPMVTRRLDTEERRAIASGSVYVWEERVSHSDPSSSEIERWTDSIRWGASKVKDEFLYYREKEQDVEIRNSGSSFSIIKMAASQRREPLTKQTYSVNVFREPQEPRKWHLIAYFSESTIDSLYCIGSHPLYPGLAYLEVPPWQYQGARVVRHPRRHSDPSRRPLLPPSPPVPSPGTQTLPSSKRTSWTIDSDSEPRDERKLAPLALTNCAGIQARHPLDEKAVMSFSICDSFHVRERPKYQLQASAM